MSKSLIVLFLSLFFSPSLPLTLAAFATEAPRYGAFSQWDDVIVHIEGDTFAWRQCLFHSYHPTSGAPVVFCSQAPGPKYFVVANPDDIVPGRFLHGNYGVD